jgi:hypothetical protein
MPFAIEVRTRGSDRLGSSFEALGLGAVAIVANCSYTDAELSSVRYLVIEQSERSRVRELVESIARSTRGHRGQRCKANSDRVKM